MNLVEDLWQHVQATQKERLTIAPPRCTDIWEDLTAARYLIHAQSLEISDLREAIEYMAQVTEGLKNRLAELEGS